MDRPELRPRAAWEVSRPVWVRKLRARPMVLGAAPVAAPSARTVPGTPVRSASAIPKVATVHRLAGRAVAGADTEVRETTTVPTANWAAPVSSSQPTPASVAASCAALDKWAAITRSGRELLLSRVWRTIAEPRSSHRTRRSSFATRTRRSPFRSVKAEDTTTRGGSTAATTLATRSVSTIAPIVRSSLIVRRISHYYKYPYYYGWAGVSGVFATDPVRARSLVLVDSNDVADRQRFTLARELGHLLFGDRAHVDTVEGRRQALEVRCDEFARNLLIPVAGVAAWLTRAVGKAECSRVDERTIALLARPFGVTPHAARVHSALPTSAG